METRRKVKYAIKRKFPVINMNDSLDIAIKLLAKSNVSVLAVKVEEELIGLLTVSDIMHAITNGKNLSETKISSFMTKCDFHTKDSTRHSCLQLDENEDVIAAIKVMNEASVNHLLVTGENTKPLGIVSSLELIKLVASL